MAVRRLHDTDRSGWWILIGLIPIIGWILLIVWFCTDSKADNQYGPNPKTGPTGQPGDYPPAPGLRQRPVRRLTHTPLSVVGPSVGA